MPSETCRCNCGYRCGGPGRCALKPFDCLEQGPGTGHFERDCDHQWDGPGEDGDMPGGGCFSSVTCSKCRMAAIDHDARVGP